MISAVLSAVLYAVWYFFWTLFQFLLFLWYIDPKLLLGTLVAVAIALWYWLSKTQNGSRTGIANAVTANAHSESTKKVVEGKASNETPLIVKPIASKPTTLEPVSFLPPEKVHEIGYAVATEACVFTPLKIVHSPPIHSPPPEKAAEIGFAKNSKPDECLVAKVVPNKTTSPPAEKAAEIAFAASSNSSVGVLLHDKAQLCLPTAEKAALIAPICSSNTASQLVSPAQPQIPTRTSGPAAFHQRTQVLLELKAVFNSVVNACSRTSASFSSTHTGHIWYITTQ